MTQYVPHAPDCTIQPAAFLRHAIAATGYLLDPPDGDPVGYDIESAKIFVDTIAHLAELPDWPSVTLQDVADLQMQHLFAAFPENADHGCTCGNPNS